MSYQLYYQTDVGRVRPHNEDAVKILNNDHCAVMVVADGMGGHEAGDVASKMVIDHVEGAFRDDLRFPTPEQARVWSRDLLSNLNDQILQYIEDKNLSKGMGTTVIITVIASGFISFAHIGDSRAYILAYKKIRQLTKDHTFVRKLVDEGKLTEKAARFHPHRNIIMNALGVNKTVKFDYLVLENIDLESVMICTDGLTSMVDDREIAEILGQRAIVEEKVRKLIQIANENGGKDNISIALCEFAEGSVF